MLLTVLNHVGIAVVFRGGHDGDVAAWVIVDGDIKAALTRRKRFARLAALLLVWATRLSPLQREKW